MVREKKKRGQDQVKLKVIQEIPVKPKPVLNQEYEVVRVVENCGNARNNLYIINCQGKEIGVLGGEIKITEG